jgi:hypothetical protein
MALTAPSNIVSNSTAAAAGITALVRADGALLVATDPTTLFQDPFDGGTIDTTNTWTTQVSTGTVTQSAGQLAISSSTTGSAYAAIYSKPTFPPLGEQAFFGTVQLEATTFKANLLRFWGLATVPGTPTTAVPITDGIGFQLDAAGALKGIVYASGAVAGSVTLSTTTSSGTSLLDGVFHRYAFIYRADFVIFYIDDFAVPAGILYYTQPAVQALPLAMVAVNGSTPPTAGQVFNVNLAALVDWGKNSQQISDGTYPWRKMGVDSLGAARIRNYERLTATYSAAFNVAPAASATDVAVIGGSASKTINVTKVIIGGTQTTAGLVDVLLIKRSTADTGGTSAGATAVPYDSTDAAATATVLAYTANPTTGTTVGAVRRAFVPVDATTSIINPTTVFDFGASGKPIKLRGTAQQLAVNLNGVTVTGGSLDISFEWYEDAS